ncbi:MAG: D-alanyl-D-alanine carboxypeptidase [Clostridia bacterium]|nr:D-alanyl-D-alanine carboxypeptidase [Clostridia bacterium]
MKKTNLNLYVIILLLAAVIFSFLTIYAFGEHRSAYPSVSGRAAVLYQPESDLVLYAKNADQRLPMASTTKIMTALIALETCKLDEVVDIDDSAIGTEGSSAYLRLGDQLTVEELLYALLLQSANDAAVAIACHIGGDVDGFSSIMKERAASLALSDTHFTNPHGLDHKKHYTTALDLARITAEAMRNEKFCEITSTYKKTFATEERSRTYVNHNKLLNQYDGCIGVKTGFTKKSGRCLVSAAERDGLRFITVTLNAPSDWADHTAMLNFGFATLEKVIISTENDHIYKLPVIDGEKDCITVTNKSGFDMIVERADRNINEQVRLVRYAIAPIREGDRLGEIIYSIDEEVVTRIPLVATESVNKKENVGLFKKILSIFD